jgi:hypothetical protein
MTHLDKKSGHIVDFLKNSGHHLMTGKFESMGLCISNGKKPELLPARAC